jgi:RHS repeat-associated protein
LIGVQNVAGTHSYIYRPDGLRNSKTFNGTTIKHVWDGQNISLEMDDSGNIIDIYTRGINLIKSVANGYYLYNAHGDVVQLTDANGVVTKSYNYDAFGNERNPDTTDANPFRYCGEYFDKETGTIYLRSRYYDPAIGRFTQQDAWGYANPSDPLSLNLYTYANNNPIMYMDSSGRFAILATIGIVAIGTLVGGALDLGSQLIANGGDFETVNWRSVGASAAAGAVTTGMGILTGGLSLGATGTIAAGALIAGEGYFVYNAVNGTPNTAVGTVIAMSSGAIVGGVTYKIANAPMKLSSNKGTRKTVFPEDPKTFNPDGLVRKEYNNGKIIKWHDPKTGKAVYEWNADPKYGNHYHVTPDGKNRIPHPDRRHTYKTRGKCS